MDGDAVTVETAAPKKRPPRKKKPPLGTADLVFRAVSAYSDRKGMSFYNLKRALASQGYDVDSNNIFIKRAVKTMVSKGVLVQTKGTGACGSYKVNKDVPKPKSKANKAAAVKRKAAKPPKSEKPAAARETPPRKAKKRPKKEKP